MSEITVTFTLEEAQSFIPWKGDAHSLGEWNRRADHHEDAVRKVRAAIREQAAEPMAGQETFT